MAGRTTIHRHHRAQKWQATSERVIASTGRTAPRGNCRKRRRM